MKDSEYIVVETCSQDKLLREHQSACYSLLCEFDSVCKKLGIPYFLFAGTLLGAVRHEGFIPWDDDLDVIMLREDYERFLKEAPKVINEEQFFLQKEYSDHWPMFFTKLRKNCTTCIEPYPPKDLKTHNGIYMDIFPCDNAFKSRIGQIIQYLSSKVIIAKGLDKRGYITKSRCKKVFMCICRVLPLKPFHAIVRGPKNRQNIVHSFLGGASKFSKNIYPSAYFNPQTVVMRKFETNEFPISSNYDELLRILYGEYNKLPPLEERKVKKHTVLVDLNRSYEDYEDYRKTLTFVSGTMSIR